MRKLLIMLSLAALALPASAIGGGWATVGVTPPPDDIGPGQTWNAELKILQHGVTPLEGVEPTVMISNGSSEESFPATPTGEPGVYVAKVVFPSGGEWSYRVNDGFSQTHSFAPVSIGGPVAGDGARVPGDDGDGRNRGPARPFGGAFPAGSAPSRPGSRTDPLGRFSLGGRFPNRPPTSCETCS